MMLQKKLVIGITAFVFSGIALGANTIQPAQSQHSSAAKQSAQASQQTAQVSQQTAQAEQESQDQEPAESVLSPGARLVAGESQNEFYILDKNDPMPVKKADAAQQNKDKKPDTVVQVNTTANTVTVKDKNAETADKAAPNTNVNKDAENISAEFEDAVNSETVEASVAMNKQGKHNQLAAVSTATIETADDETTTATAPVRHVSHGHAAKKNVAAVKEVKAHVSKHLANRHAAVNVNVAQQKSAKHVAIRKLVEQIEVVPYTSVRHVKTAKAAARKKTPVHVETAVMKVKAKVAVTKKAAAKVKVAGTKKPAAKVKVALNENTSNNEIFRDTVTTPEIY